MKNDTLKVKVRLQKYLRDCLGVSRRFAEEYIINGDIFVNGKVATIGMSVEPGKDVVKYQSKVLKIENELVYIMLNKPAGYVTSRFDPHNPKTVYSLLPPELTYVFPVGRLDLDTEGLLLLTNDGDLTYKLTHPKFEVEKEYYAIVDGQVTPDEARKVERGMKTKEFSTAKAKVTILKFRDGQSHINITLHEGQNREVRRIFGYLRHRVIYLSRFRFKDLRLEKMAIGEWRYLDKKEVQALQ